MFQLCSGNSRYNFARDIVQLFPRVIGYWASVKLSKQQWPPAIKAYAEHMGLQQADLAEAETALAKFVALSVHDSCPDYPTLVVQSGLDKLKPPVMLTLMAAIGEVTCGVFLKTIRASHQANRAIPGADLLGDVAERAAYALKTDSPRVAARRAENAMDVALPSLIENDPQ